jgi:uncharacterized membrane protein YheB (UPF0754 family)
VWVPAGAMEYIAPPSALIRYSPTHPPTLSTRLGTQGLFLKRQQEVSAEFSDFLTTRVLTSEKLWDNMLKGDKSSEFRAVLSEYTHKFASTLSQDKLGLLMDG